jgi:hypothetical protein
MDSVVKQEPIDACLTMIQASSDALDYSLKFMEKMNSLEKKRNDLMEEVKKLDLFIEYTALKGRITFKR